MRPMAHAVSRPRKTVQDFLALPDETRAELIRGEIYVTPSPTPSHQDVVATIHAHLKSYGRTKRAGQAFLAPLDVHLPSGEILQPDVLFVATGNHAIFPDAIHGVPDLVVEVVSPSRPERDRIVKRILYEENGVPEYWIADLAEASIEVLRFLGSEYVPAGYFLRTEILTTPSLPGFALPLDEVFAPLPESPGAAGQSGTRRG
jgi:Uma2 family endonuclease